MTMIADDPEGGRLVARKVLEGHGNKGTWLVSRLGRSLGQDLAKSQTDNVLGAGALTSGLIS